MRFPHLLDENGHCGTVVLEQSRHLPLLVGGAVDTCPTATGLQHPEVLALADLVPSLGSEGTLAGVPAIDLPPFYRGLLDAAHGWMAEYRAKRPAAAQSAGGAK